MPTVVPELEGVRKLRALGSLTCGLDGQGRIRCRNFAGPLPRWQLGLLESFGRVDDFALGGGILARRADGTVLWFADFGGSISSTDQKKYAGTPRAEPISGITDAISVSGADGAGCVLRRSGARQCRTQGLTANEPLPGRGALPGIDVSLFGERLAKARQRRTATSPRTSAARGPHRRHRRDERVDGPTAAARRAAPALV